MLERDDSIPKLSDDEVRVRIKNMCSRYLIEGLHLPKDSNELIGVNLAEKGTPASAIWDDLMQQMKEVNFLLAMNVDDNLSLQDDEVSRLTGMANALSKLVEHLAQLPERQLPNQILVLGVRLYTL